MFYPVKLIILALEKANIFCRYMLLKDINQKFPKIDKASEKSTEVPEVTPRALTCSESLSALMLSWANNLQKTFQHSKSVRRC